MGSAFVILATAAGIVWMGTRGASGFARFVENEERKANGSRGVRWMHEHDSEDEDEDVPVYVDGNRPKTYRATVRRRL